MSVAACAWAVLATGLALLLLRDAARRREMLARACHEVRGPLTAATLALHGAARRGDAAAAVVGALELELRRAARALGDVQGPAPDRAAVVDVGALLEAQARTWDEGARRRGGGVRLVAAGPLPAVRADVVRLAQAVGNLVANAVEHGGGRVEIRARELGDRLRIEVADDGPGLPAPVDVLTRRARGGRGARGRGLAIAAAIARRAGGRLVAAPSATGACLALELPLAESAVTLAPWRVTAPRLADTAPAEPAAEDRGAPLAAGGAFAGPGALAS